MLHVFVQDSPATGGWYLFLASSFVPELSFPSFLFLVNFRLLWDFPVHSVLLLYSELAVLDLRSFVKIFPIWVCWWQQCTLLLFPKVFVSTLLGRETMSSLCCPQVPPICFAVFRLISIWLWQSLGSSSDVCTLYMACSMELLILIWMAVFDHS